MIPDEEYSETNEQPKGYMLAIYLTISAYAMRSSVMTYEECATARETICQDIEASISAPLPLRCYGFADTFVFPQHIVRIDIESCVL